MSLDRVPITAEGAPDAVGPYSHGVVSNGLLYCSGQTPIDPATNELISGPAGDQARRCLQNLEAVCSAAGARLSDAIRLTVWLTSMDDFAEVNEVYATFFDDAPPARVTVAVAALPKGADVEIDAIVALDR